MELDIAAGCIRDGGQEPLEGMDDLNGKLEKMCPEPTLLLVRLCDSAYT